MERYDHKKIEKKWQEKWEKEGAFQAIDSGTQKKNYLLVEFPYPSGDGLHVGHVRPYIGLDVVARKRRAEGNNVLYPIGWDAFGLPTENYAIQTRKDPKIVTKENTDTFRRQIKSLGASFDWSREINTSDPKYYKWTQWMFLQLYKQGLAYKAQMLINWCPKDKIGLANEEVLDGLCERCGTPVEKRLKEQWMLAITKYAQRLYDDLDTVSYLDAIKTQQRNWIGPSDGAEIPFSLSNGESVTVFTTRPDTLFGATYLVLAPEHSLLSTLITQVSNEKEILAYVAQAKNKKDIDRIAEGKEKTGIELKGMRALNPATKEEIPIFVADYVLSTYGTGAIMGVPAHDARDWEFAQAFHLPVRYVVMPHVIDTKNPPKSSLPTGAPRRTIHALVRNPKNDTVLGLQWKKFPWVTFIVGGVEEGEDLIEAARREVSEEGGYKNIKFIKFLGAPIMAEYCASHNGENRIAITTGILFDLVDEERSLIAKEELEAHEPVWLSKKDITPEYMTSAELPYWLQNLIHDTPYTGEGILINSGEFSLMPSGKAAKEITTHVGGSLKRVYKLRDWLFSRQHYWGEPIPMVFCESCGWVPILEKDLPLLLPEVKRYEPTDTGESPLASISDWVNTTCPNCGGVAKRETDVMPNWAGSSWYYLRYCDQKNTAEFASKEKLNYWIPVDWYNGGMEHTTLHLLYSRFWHKALYDMDLVPTREPYIKRTSHGLILAENGEKMSKSRGNVINPDEVIERFGADSLRLYEMFLAPFDQAAFWSDSGIVGMYRFLERVWKFFSVWKESQGTLSPETEQVLNYSIQKISSDIEELKLNTAVSQLMILFNRLEREQISKEVVQTFLVLLTPFAPHITHELWEGMGGDFTALTSWPNYDAKKILAGSVEIAVQINGKLRAIVTLSRLASENEALTVARAHPGMEERLRKGREKRVVYVPGKVINFILEGS